MTTTTSARAGPGSCCRAGRKSLLYDNVIWGNLFGVIIAGGSEARVYNNTICRNRGPGVRIPDDGLTSGNERPQQHHRHNPDPNLFNESKTSRIDHNLLDGNPRFRDLASDDFHLLPGSPAIDSGCGDCRRSVATTTAFLGPRARFMTGGPMSKPESHRCRPRPAYSGYLAPARTFPWSSASQSPNQQARQSSPAVRPKGALTLHHFHAP